MLVVAAVDSDIIGMPVSSNDWKEYFLKNGNRYELSGRVVGKRVGGAGRKPSIDSVPLPQRLKGPGNQRKAAREQIFDSASHLPDPSRNGMRTQESRVRQT